MADSVLAGVPPEAWRKITPACNGGDHFGCPGCGCGCHPGPLTHAAGPPWGAP